MSVHANRLVVTGASAARYDEILTPEALAFVAELHGRFDGKRRALLEFRSERQKFFDNGGLPDFLPETAHVRDGDWKVAPIPADLTDRRVEITGPVDRKMIVNALNSGARVFMADFEDASSPVWSNMVEGQLNLKDRWAGAIDFTDAKTGKAYKVGPRPAVLIIRPRGWHLPERHITFDGAPASGSLVDFGLYVFHNAKAALAQGSGPYFYLPKLESHLEGRLWDEVFSAAEEWIGLAHGTIKATVLIETIVATFEMDEILWELKDHSAGLNCGRWDYIFSFIKKFREQEWAVLPDRGTVGMTSHFLRSYSQLVIKTCHRREVHAMGGMAAQIPIKNDPKANEEAMGRVHADKKREAGDGHDGTWVAHPGLVPIAKGEFDAVMKEANQIARKRQDVNVTAADLIQIPTGPKTEAGLRQNVAVGIGYVEAWLRGIGCVPLFNLMEDAATAEISRAQVWQWVRHNQKLDDGRAITKELVREIVREENDKVKAQIGEEAYAKGRYEDAAQLMIDLVEQPQFYEFLTLPAYDRIMADEKAAA